ncbi:MAG TPA: hypothetical protein VHI13_17640 [Candidatus Kapabacteria bacterium]|nr:hypothetical protein [Candidatus Kapabacteria bacterium]
MISRIRTSAMMMAAALTLAAFACIQTASAQLPWNPPCPNTTINNTTLCTAQLNLVTIPAGAVPPVLVPAGTAVVIPTPPPGLQITGITSFGGFFYPVNPPAPPLGIGCLPTDFWIQHVTLGPPPGCCFNICFDVNTCTITLTNSPVPPKCRP